jgi:acyl-CoA synthetase (AMP-forming)/AMP-acid ligase II
VVGVPHERHGEVPKAFVVARVGTALAADGGLDGPARVEAVLAKLRPRLAEYKVR